MRKTLIAAVAMAPLVLAAGAAQAQYNVTTSSTTPIATATVNNGAPEDITIGTGGNISAATSGTPSSPLALVTLNSNNNVSNVSGTLASSNFSNVIGLYANIPATGLAGSLTNLSAITLSTTFTAPTTADGYAQAPFAGAANPQNGGASATVGDYGLYGIRVTGPGSLTGAVDNGSGAVITIKGNNSYGISIETPITGALTNEGTITLTGDNGVALQTLKGANVGGIVQITGSIAATGLNSSAVALNGNIGGALSLYSSISATDYALTSRTSNLTLLGKLETAANYQTLLAGAAFIVGGNVSGGIYIGGAPSGTVSGSGADLTGDGIADGAETTGSITSYGSAPALVIGAQDATTTAITIGGFNDVTGNALDNGYGLVMRGTITGLGVYDNISSTALQIGNLAGGVVNLSNGIAIYGSVTAQSYWATGSSSTVVATAMQLTGASSPNINIFGSVSATVAASAANTTVGIQPSLYAYGINEAGAKGVTLPSQSLLVTGAITATATGDNAHAIAVQDTSGAISSVTNEGVISGTTYVSILGDAQNGGAPIALDLRANTTGVTLLQQINPNPNHAYGSVSGAATTAETTLTAVTPIIQGDVYLGNGVNHVDLEAGYLIGALSMGNGSGGSLTLNGGATLTGALTYGGSGLAINLANGVLNDLSPKGINAASLQIGSQSTLSFAFDPVGKQVTTFTVNGASVNGANNVVIASGAKFGLTAVSLPTLGQSYAYNVITSNLPISLGGTTSITLSSVPYLLQASLVQSDAKDITLNIEAKTASQMGLNKSESALLGSLLTVAPNDPEVRSVLLAPTNRTNFLKIYDAFLPQSSGGVFEAGRLASDAVSRATSTHDMTPGVGGTQNYWMQEIVIGAHSERTSANNPFDVGGFGAVAGAALGGYGFGAVGVTAALTSISVLDAELKGAGQQAVTTLEAGLYWQASVKHLTLDLRAAFGGASIDGTRQLFAYDQTTGLVAVNRTVKDNRYGYTGTLHGGASYEWSLGHGLFLRPQARLDYFYMAEDSYKEKDLVALNSGAFPSAFALNVNSVNGDALTGVASVAFGANWGSDFRLRPQIEVGLRDAVAGSPGTTTAQFVSGGTPFTLTPSPINGVGGVLRLGLKASTNFYEVGVEAGGETHDRYYSGDARVTIRLMF